MANDQRMDRPRPERQWTKYRTYALLGFALAVLILAFVIDRYMRTDSGAFDANDFVFAEVKIGALTVSVDGTGELQPASEQWVTVKVGGVVDRLITTSGSTLKTGDPIAELTSPTIVEALELAELGVAEAEQTHASKLASLKSQLLNYETRLLQAQTNYQETLIQLEAETKLQESQAQRGIDFERTKLRTQLLKDVLEKEENLLSTVKEANAAERHISETRLQNARNTLNRAVEDLEGLVVRAPSSGTLQEILVEVGEHVPLGTRIARIADTSILVAIVRVPANRANELSPGQTASIRVLGRTLRAKVVRIAPSVTQGTVEAELQFKEKVPDGARPELSVNAIIDVANLAQTLYVRRPSRVDDNSIADVFVLGRDQDIASRTPVSFGVGTLRDLEVVSGLNEGDRIVLGSYDRFGDQDTIRFEF